MHQDEIRINVKDSQLSDEIADVSIDEMPIERNYLVSNPLHAM